MKKILLLFILTAISSVSALAQQENPRGLFKLQKFIYDDGSEKVAPFNQYKYCTDYITLQIELVEDKARSTTGFHISNNDHKSLSYTGNVPVGEDGKGTQIFDSSKKGFTLRWYNTTMLNHQLFPYDSFISETYTAEKVMPANMQEVFNMLNGNIKAKKQNKFAGTWKRRGMTDRVDGKGQMFEAGPMYKIYADGKMLIISGRIEDPNTMAFQGNMWPYEYYTDRLIIENQSSCLITWLNDNAYSLIWVTDEGYPMVEIWDRYELSDAVKRAFSK